MNIRIKPLLRRRRSLLGLILSLLILGGTTPAYAAVSPLLKTTWGQGGLYQSETPTRNGDPTYPGCTTIASAQILYYYQYKNTGAQEVYYSLDNKGLTHSDISNDTLYLDLTQESYDFSKMAPNLDQASESQIKTTAEFIYHVGASMHAQFGNGEGSSATGKQIENAFRYTWGFNNLSRRSMSIISKDAFGYNDDEWAEVIRNDLDEGRPVLHMALKVGGTAGHAFVIDGYNDAGLFHVNWGWGGWANGYYDVNTLEDPSGRRWSRNALIFRNLEPEKGFAKALLPDATGPEAPATYSWNGNGSLISYTSDKLTGYGLNKDEGVIHPSSSSNPIVFFQWEIDSRDGQRIEFDADGVETASITYGPWNDRTTDRTYHNVKLPFILDPTKDGFSAASGQYYVFAIHFDKKPSGQSPVYAQATKKAGTSASSTKAASLNVGGYAWNGNGSIISYTSADKKGYGLTLDEAMIHPSATTKPVVFFQWEVDAKDGKKLRLSADGQDKATITYGSWRHRTKDITKVVTLPFTLDPTEDDLQADDGSYWVIRVAFEKAPQDSVSVIAETVQ